MSKIEVNQIDTISGSSTLLVGPSAATKLTFSSTLTVDFNVNSPGVTLGSTMKNTPAFHARLSADQSYSSLTNTKVQFNTEVLDTDGNYDNSTNYRFTPTTAGKYFIYTQVKFEYSNSVNKLFNLKLRKNGSDYAREVFNEYANDSHPILDLRISTIVDMNGSTDYLEVFGYVETDSGSFGGSSVDESYFGGYKVIGA